MILRHPISRLIVDGQSYSSAEAAVGSLDVRLSLGGSHDAARVTLWSSSKAATAAPDARASIALGEGSDMVDVWAGTLCAVEGSDRRVVLEGLSHTAKLSRQRVTNTWQQQSVANIVRDLVGEVEIDSVDATLELPWYAADARRTVWSHVRELATLVGADVTSSSSGGVRFVPVSAGSSEHTLRYGAELLRWRLGELTPTEARGVRSYGAASESGAQQWHWLLGDSGQSSSSASVPGAIRTKDAADLTAQARTDRAARQAHRGVLLAVGSPAMRPGDTVLLSDVPAAPTDRYRITALVHRLDGVHGFTTSVRVEGAAA